MHSKPVLSLQTGRKVTFTSTPIIDPRDLTIAAYWCSGNSTNKKRKLLSTKDIREYSSVGFIIDSEDELLDKEDVIALRKLIDINFNLIGIDVYDDDGKKIGKVEDYSIESKTFVIEQLRVRLPLIRSFNSTSYLIGRSQVLEITDKKIIVKSTKSKSTESMGLDSRGFVNPFATTNPQTEISEFSN